MLSQITPDIDECLLAAMRGEQPCADSEVCYNSDGGYMCVCAPGQYRVSGVCASELVGMFTEDEE